MQLYGTGWRPGCAWAGQAGDLPCVRPEGRTLEEPWAEPGVRTKAFSLPAAHLSSVPCCWMWA